MGSLGRNFREIECPLDIIRAVRVFQQPR
jgi:hypothetical protein